jgi:ATP-binding cassette, subfamily C, bacterial LapB
MKQLLARITGKPLLALELATATFFINILALAAPFFFILVFNRYLTGGVDGTLITLTAGMLMAVLLQFLFRAVRTRMAADVGIRADDPMVRSFFEALTRARLQALSRVRKSRIYQASGSLQLLQSAFSAPSVNSVLDMPYSFLFIGVIFLLNFQLGVVASIGAVLTLGSALFAVSRSRKSTGMLQEISAGNQVLLNSAVNEPETLRVFGGARYISEKWAKQVSSILSLRRFSAHNEDISQSRLMGP